MCHRVSWLIKEIITKPLADSPTTDEVKGFFIMNEIWKEVKGYEGIYEVSNIGRVKSLKFNKEKILKAGLNSNGYLTVSLCKYGSQKTRKVHKLVAEAFLYHTPCGFELVVNHIDINKTNNKVDNLELVTSRENSNRKHIESTSKYVGVSWKKQNNKWRSQIEINGKKKHLGYFTDEFEAHLAYQTELKKINQ